MKSLFRLFLAACLWMALPAHAGSNETVNRGIRTTNHSGYVIAADAVTGHTPDRSIITGEFILDFAWDTVDNIGANYEAKFWFEDETGAVLPIYDSNGGPQVTELTHLFQVNLNASHTTETYTVPVAFEPASQLLPQKRYTIKAKWRKQPGASPFGAFVNVPLDASAGSTSLYFHFMNDTSGDAALNAQVYVNVQSWTNTRLINGSVPQGSFKIQTRVVANRFDDFNLPFATASVPVSITVALKDAGTGATVWTAPAPFAVTIPNVPNHTNGTGANAVPGNNEQTVDIPLTVPAGVIELEHTYQPVLTVTHDDGPSTVSDGTGIFAAQELLWMTGNFYFGTVLTRFTQQVNNVIANGAFVHPSPGITELHSQLQIPYGFGFLPNVPEAKYGANSYGATITEDGDAYYTGGSSIHLTGDGTKRTSGGISYTLDPVLTNSGSGTMSVTVNLPDGFSVSPDLTLGTTDATLTFTGQALNANLSIPPTLSTGAMAIACYCDRVPLWFVTAGGLTWMTSTGRIESSAGVWVDPFINDRVALTSVAGSGQLANPTSFGRPSNIGHFGYAHNDPCDGIEVTADSAGRAQLTARVDFSAGFYAPHFPLAAGAIYTEIATITGGHIQFADNFVTNTSVLQVSDLTVAYNRRTAADPCAGTAGGGFINIGTTNDLRFTQDGGLAGAVTLNTNGGIKFGATQNLNEFAHELPAFTSGWFMMPGYYLPGGEASTLPTHERPAALLLSGSTDTAGNDFDYTERPDSAPYAANGAANYAGVNVLVPTLTTGAGSLLGGYFVSYNLMSPSKYYIRPGGVSGITQADVGSFSEMPVPVYGGLGLDLQSYKLSFLDGINMDSVTDGGVMVGGPSNFTLLFEGLKLGPTGQLTTADVKESEKENFHTLDYWKVRFKPKEMRFLSPQDGTCPLPGEGFLTVGMDAELPLIGKVTGPSVITPEPIFGVLGFKGSGDLVTQGDPLAKGTGIDSRFQLPSNIPVLGVNGNFTLQAVSKASLNRWEYANSQDRPQTGFMSFAGRLDVPFFESVKVHVHTNNDLDTAKQLYLMGGWNASDNEDSVGVGWHDENDTTFFNNPDYDPDHTGYPGLTKNDLDAYRKLSNPNPNPDPDDNTYRPRAMKNWYGVVNFDYPLQWQSGFLRSPGQLHDTPLVLFSLNHEVKSMSASHADLRFDAAIAPNVKLPDVSVASLLTDPNALGILNSALGSIGSPFDFSLLTKPLDEVQGLFTDTLEKTLGSTLETALNPVVDYIYSQAQAKYTAAGGSTGETFITTFNAPAMQSGVVAQIQTAASNLLGSGGSLASTAAARVHQVRSNITGLTTKLREGGNTLALVENVVAALDDDNHNPGPDPDPSVAGTILAICDQLDVVADKLQSLESLLSVGTSDVSKELDGVLTAQAASLSSITQQSLSDVSSILGQLPAKQNELFIDYTADDMKAKIRRAVMDRLIGSTITSEVQKVFKEHLKQLVAESLQRVDGILGAIGGAVVKKNTTPLGVGEEPTYAEGRGGLSDKLKAGSLRGYARINGDSLEELRLDGSVNLGIAGPLSGGEPDNKGMKLDAYMLVKSIKSDSAVPVCGFDPGSEGLECTVGADNVPLGWAGLGSATGYAQMKFSFGNDGLPQGFDGALGINGTFSAGGMAFTDPKVIVGASPNQIYAGFALRAAFQGKEVAAKALLGRVCEIGTLTQVNEGAGNLLQSLVTSAGGPAEVPAPYTGGSLYAEGWIPLNELIGIPTTCMLNLRAGAGVGMSFFVPSGPDVDLLIGSQQLLGLSGQVLCAITVKGTLEMNAGTYVPLGDLGSSKFKLQGVGEVSAKVGISPLDYTFSKSLFIHGFYDMANGERDFGVDF